MAKKFNRWIRTKNGKLSLLGIVLCLILVAIAGFPLGWWDTQGLSGTAGLPVPSYPAPNGGYSCLPSSDLVTGGCIENDGKMFYIANAGMSTFSGSKVVVWIAVPGDYQTFDLGIFDGDSGKDLNGNINKANGHWDSTTTEAKYTLFADPIKDGTGTNILMEWYGNQSNMPDNAWFNVSIPNNSLAKSPSGHYMYRLEVTQDVQASGGNGFKLRSTGYLSTGKSDLVDTSIGIIGMLANVNDARIIYPQWVSNTNIGSTSTYSGNWQFHFYVANDQKSIEIWDGDFDRGTSKVIAKDTDDPNTDGKPVWALNNSFVQNEREGGQGAPPDDHSSNIYRRAPAVIYKLIDPSGTPIHINDDPSGTEEWERFVVSTDYSENADLFIEKLQPGFYIIDIEGLDMYNLAFIRVDKEICDVDDGCGPPEWPEGVCPRTIGYWKNNVNKVLIQNKPAGAQESRATLEWGLNNVALASPLFRSGLNISAPFANPTIARLTAQEAHAILQKANGNTMLDRALQQNLATWLNLGTGKIGPTTVIQLTGIAGGEFNGTIMEALREAENIILNGGDLERAKDIADMINNGQLNIDPEDVLPCTDYERIIPPAKQPPAHKDMPKAPKRQEPPSVTPSTPPDQATCGARVNTYGVESPTNNPFYGIKFEFQAGEEVRDGNYELFQVVLPADVVMGMTAIQMEAKAGNDTALVTLEADFTSPLPMGEPVRDQNGFFAFYFYGAEDNGDGTYTLTFQVQNMTTSGLSHTTVGLPDGVVPTFPEGSYQSEVCPDW